MLRRTTNEGRNFLFGLFCVVGVLVAIKFANEPTLLAGVFADSSAIQLADGERSADGSVHVKVKSFRRGKPQSSAVDTRIRFFNPRDESTWFLISRVNQRFTSTYFKCDWSGVPFSAKQYAKAGSVAVEVSYYSRDGFTAFLPPPGGTLDFDGFTRSGQGESPRRLQVWLASHVLVNGKTALQDWLPYSVKSSKEHRIARHDDWDNLNYRHEHSPNPEPYPNESVRFVTIKPLKRYEVELRSRGS